jgi:predicted nucleic acid-binding protein
MMVDEALGGIRLVGFDTPPFIYFVERHPTYIAAMHRVFQRMNAGLLDGVTSVITLAEALVHPKRTRDQQLEGVYKDLLLRGQGLHLLAIDPAIADVAADLRARYNVRTPDALQIASALVAGCQVFLTNDADLRRVTELRVLALDELTA